MSNRTSSRAAHALTVAGAMAMLSAAAFAAPIESSCAPPCTVLPKSALFLRQPDGQLAANGDIVPLEGTMRVGTRNTVLRVAAGIVIDVDASVPAVYVTPRINGYYQSAPYAHHSFSCNPATTNTCSATGTFWFDIDALEAAHPGEFIDRPLSIRLEGGNASIAGGGLEYEATIAADVVKKK